VGAGNPGEARKALHCPNGAGLKKWFFEKGERKTTHELPHDLLSPENGGWHTLRKKAQVDPPRGGGRMWVRERVPPSGGSLDHGRVWCPDKKENGATTGARAIYWQECGCPNSTKKEPAPS